MRKSLLLVLSACIVLVADGLRAQEPIKVVASFSILADIVREVGGSGVTVKSLVGPDGDAHVYEPTPGDVRDIAAARLIVLNGLGLEGWMNRLVEAAGYKGTVVTATTGIAPLTMSETVRGRPVTLADPHAWQDLRSGYVYVANVAEGLAAADPAHATQYRANAEAYLARLRELDAWVMSQLSTLPRERRKIITSHDAFGYFGRRYGITFRAPVGLSTEQEASAADVAKLIRQIRAERIPAVFMENVSNTRLLLQITRETKAKIGGTLYSDALSAADGPAATYIEMFRHNVRTLTAALGV